MGKSEWGFLIESDKDLNLLKQIIQEHNNGGTSDSEQMHKKQMYGEELFFYAILTHNNKFYACVGNGGGREYTSDFFMSKWTGIIYYPFNKPNWWLKCQNYVWKTSNKEDNVPEFNLLV